MHANYDDILIPSPLKLRKCFWRTLVENGDFRPFPGQLGQKFIQFSKFRIEIDQIQMKSQNRNF